MTMNNEQAYWAVVKSDPKAFLQQAFSTVYPGKQFLDNWHIDAILFRLTLGFQGKMPRLIINLPPRYLKSFIVSVVWPAFVLGLDPAAKIICVSYSEEITKVLARDFRRIVESEWYRKLFPNVVLTKSTEGEVVTDQGGGRYAISVGGSLTGRGGDYIIIDDPIRPEDVLSAKARQSNNEWFKSTLLSRLDDKQLSVLILVMQRLHVNDLTGFIEGSGGFHKLSLPAIAKKDEYIAVGAEEFYHREVDEPLHAERENLQVLEDIRNQIGLHNFTAQYQQSPEAPEGALFKKHYLQVTTVLPKIRPCGRWWISIDSALSTSETADYSAITLGYSDETGHYILNAERGRWDYEALKGKALHLANIFPEATFVVEHASSGISLIQYMKKHGISVMPHLAKGDKMARAALVIPIFADKRVSIVRRAGHEAWIEPLINEFLSFPFGRFDDKVDSVVQALRWAEPWVNPGGKVYLCG